MTSEISAKSRVRPLPREEGLGLLKRWARDGTRVGLVYAAPDSAATVALKGRLRVDEPVLRLVTSSGGFHVAIGEASFEHGPILLFDRFFQARPSDDGLRITTPKGDWLFVAPISGSASVNLELEP